MMVYPKLITVAAEYGTAAIDPDAVVFVLKVGAGSQVRLISGVQLHVNEEAEAVASRLWPFLNATDNGYFNEKHLLAVVPTMSGSKLLFASDTSLDTAVPSDIQIAMIATINGQRAGILAARGSTE